MRDCYGIGQVVHFVDKDGTCEPALVLSVKHDNRILVYANLLIIQRLLRRCRGESLSVTVVEFDPGDDPRPGTFHIPTAPYLAVLDRARKLDQLEAMGLAATDKDGIYHVRRSRDGSPAMIDGDLTGAPE